MHRKVAMLASACFLLSWCAGSAEAFKPGPPIPFEELVLRADFVGIAECVTAGVLVAEYRVIESWKGHKAGERIRIRRFDLDLYSGANIPHNLCGQHFFIAAQKQASDPTHLGDMPLRWRRVAVDYRLPFFRQGLTPREPQEKIKLSEKENIAKQLASLTPGRQEAMLLAKPGVAGMLAEEKDEKLKRTLEKEFAALQTPEEIVDKMLALARAEPMKWTERVERALVDGGRAVALKKLEDLPADKSPWPKEDLAWLVRVLRAGQGLESGLSEHKEKPPTKQRLTELQKALQDDPTAKDHVEALYRLTAHDASAVAAALARFKQPEDFRTSGYELASFFASKCRNDRVKNLGVLLKAQDDYVRVAGAVYLCFEDEKEGMAALKELKKLPGGPGAWAALTLARRGDKDAALRLIATFGQEFHDARDPNSVFRVNALVLFSNSARKHGVPQPPSLGGDNPMQAMQRWWADHGDRITLHDPWLKELEKQKVD